MHTDIPASPPNTPLLDQVNSPWDLKTLSISQLEQLAEELRAFLLYSVGKSGGHFGAGLGVIELTIALHFVLDTPTDDLIWDVGHQAYPHKILTGRRKAMHSIRKLGGIAPFPAREESHYDSFGVGHSSTSLSAALGMALAKQHTAKPSHTVAVIGDGAMTAGMAYEAMNHIAHVEGPVLIILNDNTMSISANVGGLADYLEKKGQHSLRDAHSAPGVHQANLFDDLGVEYSGPVDGHNIAALVDAIKTQLDKDGPSLLHVQTLKGKGFAPAERDPVGYHAITKLEQNRSATSKHSGANISKYQDVFGAWLCKKAQLDKRAVAITPAMCEGSGLTQFAKEFPERFFDVAIAEQHALTFAAGLACKGLKPVVAIYSTFLQRAYDQLIHDIALQNLDVTFALDRAGVVGEDGATHTGALDMSALRCVPNLIIGAPSSAQECSLLLDSAYDFVGPAVIRYPRGQAFSRPANNNQLTLQIGKGQVIRETKLGHESDSLCLLNFGAMLEPCLVVAEQHDCGLVDMRWIKPLDRELLLNLTKRYKFFVCVEDGVSAGGAGSAVRELFQNECVFVPVLSLGLPDEFIQHGSRAEVLQHYGLNAQSISDAIYEWRTKLSN